MKLALISDTHGNLSALEAALADIEQLGADRVVCLGDVASFGPQPQETLRRVQALGCPVVLGNTDAYLLKPRTLQDIAKPKADTPLTLDIESWCAERLDDSDRDFIRTFQETVRLELGGLDILCFHASPRNYNDIITANTPDGELATYLETRAPLMFGGHTHTQLLRRFQDTTFINPGSIGLPHEILVDGTARNPARAEYALLEVVRGQPSVTFRRVPYDLGPLLEAVEASGMPHGEVWAADFSGEPAP